MSETATVPQGSTWLRIVRFGSLLFAAGSVMLLAVFVIVFFGALEQGRINGVRIFVSVVFALATLVMAIGSMTLVVMDHKSKNLDRVRRVASITLTASIVSVVFSIFAFGVTWIAFVYLFQFAWLSYVLTSTDPNLDRSQHFHNPWRDDELPPKGYIPLNFFNIFWVFVIASVVGLIVEVIFHAMTVGGYQDRAGLIWGPFSPIYGFGAVLMTIALNRFWNKSTLLVFVIAGIIGAAFEWFVSWFLETGFGVVAWDYTGTFGSIGGRTNFAFGCAWGFLGVFWIKLLLPQVLRLVDAIPLKWRTVLTVIMASFLLVDGAVTLVALDAWYQRASGVPPSNPIQVFCAKYFDNDFMQNRFQSMTMKPGTAGRVEG